ncbi:MAG: MarR family winged helix-turn-helix transcriptional regulator [Alphaproteobacteria bacterium]
MGARRPPQLEEVTALSLTDAPALDLDGLQDLLGFQLRMAQITVHRDFAATMAEAGLTQKQLATLMLIRANPGVSQADIAALLGTDRATMMALIDRLADRDLVERRRSNTDRRRQELHLTATGKTFLVKCDRLLAEHEARFTSRFSEKELKALFAALARLHGQEEIMPSELR